MIRESTVDCGGRAAALVEAIDPALLRDPIDFLLADHYRLSAVLNLIDKLARDRTSSEVRRRIANAVLAFFCVDLAQHVEDEERDLFPLLRKRLARSATLPGVLEQVQAEHEADDRALRLLTAMLSKLAARPGTTPSNGFRVAAAGFVQALRCHLAWENAVVMPLLRTHLKRSDLRALTRHMAARRGIKPSRPLRRAGEKLALQPGQRLQR